MPRATRMSCVRPPACIGTAFAAFRFDDLSPIFFSVETLLPSDISVFGQIDGTGQNRKSAKTFIKEDRHG